MKFTVWHEFNGEEGFANEFVAHNAQYAAIHYAEADSEALCDGLYAPSEPIMVRSPCGKLERFQVSFEMVPSFSADTGKAIDAMTATEGK